MEGERERKRKKKDESSTIVEKHGDRDCERYVSLTEALLSQKTKEKTLVIL